VLAVAIGLVAMGGCGGQGGTGNGLLISNVVGGYIGRYSTSAGGSGTLSLTIGPTGAVNINTLNTGGTVVGKIMGMVANGGGFVGTSRITITVNNTTTANTYTVTGTFTQASAGSLAARFVSKLVTGTVPGNTTEMTFSTG